MQQFNLLHEYDTKFGHEIIWENYERIWGFGAKYNDLNLHNGSNEILTSTPSVPRDQIILKYRIEPSYFGK